MNVGRHKHNNKRKAKYLIYQYNRGDWGKTTGDALKVRALGADACQIGAIALVAVSHPQIQKAMPFEPPTAAVLYGKSAAKKFNVEEGAKALKNFFESCKLEMAEGIRA